MTSLRNELFGGMYKYIENIVTYTIQHNKKIIIWGAGKGGAFFTHLIRDVDGRKQISCYIDEYMKLPCGSENLKIYRSSMLNYIDKDEYVILLTIPDSKQVKKKLQIMGYEKNKDYFEVRDSLGCNYLEYLQRNNNVDFTYVTKEDCPELYNGDYFESKPFDHSSIDRVFSEIINLTADISFFDVGCGKGQILLMASIYGIKNLSGLEINHELVEIARDNMKSLGIEAVNIIEGDASNYKALDKYNCFFLYNPFGERIMKKVVSNIRESYFVNRRDIFIVYGNPFFHDIILEGGFELYKQIPVDLYDPILNVYRISG